MTADIDARDLLDLLPSRPRVLALGEPTHGEDDLLHVRNELFRQLVVEHGYRTIAIESDCLAGLVVDAYVTTGSGSLDDAMGRGFSHRFGESAANRDLVTWLRAHNEQLPPDRQVRFAGFDGPLETSGAASPRAALLALHGYAAARFDADRLPCSAATLDELLGPDERWTDPAAMSDSERSPGRSPDAARLRLLADDLVALLDGHVPDPDAREDWHRALLHGRTAVGLLRYHDALADPSPARVEHMLAVRDAMMAANLLALAERGPVLAFAQNAHLQRDVSSMVWAGQRREWRSAGALVDAHLGARYAWVAMALGTIAHRGVDAPPAGTIEGYLFADRAHRHLVDPRALPPGLTARTSPWFGYAPLDPAHLPRIDGIVFVRDCAGPSFLGG